MFVPRAVSLLQVVWNQLILSYIIREELSVVCASLKSSQEEAEVWRSQAQEAREEIESLKLHIDTLQNEKVIFTGT